MGYGLVRLPLWAVGVFAGVIWGLGLLVLPFARGSSWSVVVVLAGGAGFGTVVALVVGRQRRGLFTVEGRALSGRERVAVLRAVHLGEPLPDGEPRVVARRYAEHLDAQDQRGWPMAVAVVVMTGLNTWLAVSQSPRWWIGVVLWPAVGSFLYRQGRRQRATVERYLSASRPVDADRQPLSDGQR